jgi:hypothetical protein
LGTTRTSQFMADATVTELTLLELRECGFLCLIDDINV